jgi:hypothetical protein
MLALQQAVSCGVEVKPEVFIKLMDRYLTKQRDDGGWNYGRTDGWFATQPSYGSMTGAAVANLYLIRDILSGTTGCPCKGDSSPSRHNQKIDESIKRGFKWLGDKFSADKPPGGGEMLYWLYSVERVAIATGYKYLGKHDWYAEGATTVVRMQKGDGSFGAGDRIPDTCFALLFLIKGRGPVLMNKLEFDGEWDRHPHDAEKVADYIGGLKEQRINWQVINLDIPVEDMHDSPIMYITAESALKLTAEHKKKLRDFTDSGGTILFEASCGNNSANVNWRLISKEVWPEWELKLIDKDHPLWTADAKIVANRPLLQVASDGVRTFLFYTPKDISCLWTTMALIKNQASFDMVGNLYVYASDHSKLRAKLVGHDSGIGKKYADEAMIRGPKDSIMVTRVKHGGDWYAAKNYHPWELLARSFQSPSGMPATLALKEAEPAAPGEALPAGTNLLYLSGRTGCELGASGGKWLKDFVVSGGFIFAESVLGDKRFDESVRPALEAAGFALKPLPTDHPLLSGQLGNGAKGYNVSKPGYSFSLRPERIGQSAPSLVGLYLGDKLVGVYSPFDIMFSQTGCVAFSNRGYAAEDARALATNIILLVSAQGSAAAAPPAPAKPAE